MEDLIVQLIEDGVNDPQALADETGLSEDSLNACLASLEEEGRIGKHADGYWEVP